VRVLAVWVGCSGIGHNQACFLAARYDSLCAAIQRIEGDEVTALRLGPASDAKAAQLTLQGINDCLKLRTEDVSVLAHMLYHAVDIFEIADMAQLVYLVVTDGLEL